VVVITILSKLFIHRSQDSGPSEENFDIPDAFKSYVFMSLGTAFPMTVDVIMDLISPKRGMSKQLFTRAFICLTFILVSGLHILFSMNEQQKEQTRMYIISVNVSMIATTMIYQLKQRNVNNIISTWKYFAMFVFYQLYTLIRVFETNGVMFVAWNILRTLASLFIIYITGKHLYVTLNGSVRQDWHEKCQLLAFEIVLIMAILTGIIIRFFLSHSISRREDSMMTGVLFFVFSMYVMNTLMGLIITNDYRNVYIKLEQKLVVKRKFVSYVSHEVRTPLNNCTLGVNYMKNLLSSDPTEACIAEVREILDEVDDGCRTAVDFMNNLLLYEKTDTMDLPLYLDKGDLGVVCSEVVSSFQMSARQLEVSLNLDIHESLLLSSTATTATAAAPTVSTATSIFDYGKIVIVFRNLLSNALKFTPKQGRVSLTVLPVSLSGDRPLSRSTVVSGEILRLRNRDSTIYDSGTTSPVSSESDSGINEIESLVYLSPASPDTTTHYRVILSDTGRGMSLEEQRQLFTKIVQFSPNENQNGGGSGIGLFLSHQIMTRHDLQIQVYSDGVAGTGGAVGGTHFYVDFPVCAVSEASSEGDSNGNNMGGADDSGESGRWVGCLRGCLRKNRETEVDVFEDDNNDDITIGRMEATDIPSNIVTATTSSNLLTGGDEAAALVPAKRAASRLRRTSSIRNRELTDLSILIVDDSVINRKMVTRTLRQNCIGSIIEGVGDGTELLTLLGVGASSKLEEEFDYDLDSDDNENKDVSSNDTYDVILLDDHMTYMDGSVAARKLRRCGYKGLIIGVTGSATDEDMQAFCEAGVDFALPKPLVLKELQQLLISQL